MKFLFKVVVFVVFMQLMYLAYGDNSVYINQVGDHDLVDITQTGIGHDISVDLAGGNKTVTVNQNGIGMHQADITLTGTASSVNLTQSGSIQQNFSVISNCTSTAGCSPIIVQQGY